CVSALASHPARVGFCSGIRVGTSATGRTRRGEPARYRIAVGKTFREEWSGQTLRDDKGIVAERGKELAQHLGLFGITGHALHLGLQLLGSDRLLPPLLE